MKKKSLWKKVDQEAKKSQKNSYSPYSHFPVGAALELQNGQVFSGCNVENSSFGATLCAERTAVVKAISDGKLTSKNKIKRISVITESSPPALPCGLCRQVLSEFSTKDAEVRILNSQGESEQFTLHELLPHAFDASQLNKKGKKLK